MGCFWRRRRPRELQCVRVVHVSGYIEDFEEPITVREVVGFGALGRPPKHFLCSAPEGSPLAFGQQPLRADAVLERGRLYFLLPHSIYVSDSSSPLDLASLAARLTAISKRTTSAAKSKRANCTAGGATSPQPQDGGASRKSWKPILETIEEWSFDRRPSMDRAL